ncbi:MAG TPA: hypothetical protein VGV18_13200, partial [Verrucomicrobiae bacterium]|nr:hypothetical protein [Verrucomicrobiae bacterium]
MALEFSLALGYWSVVLLNVLENCPFFINGEWIDAKLAATPVFNPSIGEVIAECPEGGMAEVNAAVEAAAAALPG